jgi:hypothetical protein
MRSLLMFIAVSAVVGWPTRSLAAAYETRYVNGTQFTIGTEGELQVWAATWKGTDLQTMLYVVNGSESTVTFCPANVRVEALKRGRDGLKIRVLKTFSAEEYEQRARNRNANTAMLAALGAWASRPNSPQRESYTTEGRSETRDAYGAKSGSTSYSGTITTEASVVDVERERDRERARADALQARLDDSFQAIAQNLLRTQTLDPSTYYGGMVYSKKEGDDYVVTVPFGDKSFQFRFTFAR